jgi:Sec-independent protein translocase protein TatA
VHSLVRQMDSGVGQLILVGGLALVVFRPNDLPVLARGAGHLAGTAVRVLRRARESAARTLREDGGAGSATAVFTARRQLARSVKAADAISSTLRREVGPLGFDPRQFMLDDDDGKSSHRPAQQDVKGREGSMHVGLGPAEQLARHGRPARPAMVVQENVFVATEVEPADESARLTPIFPHALQASTGADIVSSAIENAALAAMHERVLSSQASLLSPSRPPPQSPQCR